MTAENWLQSLLVSMLVVLVPIMGARYDRRLKTFTSTARRIAWYQTNVAVGCALAALSIAAAHPQNILISPGGAQTAPWLDRAPVFFAAIAMTLTYSALGIGQGLRVINNLARRARLAKSMRSLSFFLPVSDQERRWWILVSLSAGVCEEILYRGFLMHYFTGSLAAGIPLGGVTAWLLCSFVFGLGHVYQGVSGVIRTSLAGLVLGLIAALSGSLLLSITLHILFDMQVLWIYRPVHDDPQSASRLIGGCSGQLSSTLV